MNMRRLVIVGMSAAAVIALSSTALNLLPVAATPSSSTPMATAAARPAAGHAGTPGKRLTTEVLPPTARNTVPVLPPSKSLPAIFEGALPKSASARGKLVAGFPVRLPIVAESIITRSSVSSSSGRMQTTLDATAPRAPRDLIAFYESMLGKYGLSSVSLPAVGGSTAVGFSRGRTSITLTVTPSGSHGSRYLLFAVLSPQG